MVFAACEPPAFDEVSVDVSPFQGGCEGDVHCVVVSQNACDCCQDVRDAVISRPFGDEYADAMAEAAEACENPQPTDLCGSSDDLVDGVCVEGTCEAVPLE